MSWTVDAAISAGAVAVSAAGGLAWATMAPSSQLFGRTLVAGDDPAQIALTYDDGPNPAATPNLLEVLARHNVHATFFLIGRFVQLEPELTRAIAAAGHTIGNHSWSHPRLPLLSKERIREELAACNAILEDTLGQPIRLFRPPYGWRRPAVLRIARELGMEPVSWNVMVGDWKPVAAETLLARLTGKIAHNRRRGRASNIVLHDGGQAGLNQPRLATVEATRRLMELHPHPQYVTPEAWLSKTLES